MNVHKLCILLIVVFLTFAASNKNTSISPYSSVHKRKCIQLSEPWNVTFSLKETAEGECMGIGAVFCNDTAVYIYELAEGTIVVLDTSLSLQRKIPLSSIGRNTYIGDDFVVFDTTFIFLNSVDRRLEYLNVHNGTYIRSISLPRTLLSSVAKRAHRILNRLFLDNKILYIGNELHLVPWNCSLGKQQSGTSIIHANPAERFILYRSKKPIVQIKKDTIQGFAKKKRLFIPTHYPLSGKRYFTLHRQLYTICAKRDSIYIKQVK